MSQQSFNDEHNRLLNILGVIRSQWQLQGRPQKLKLDWHSELNSNNNVIGYVAMADGGWPIPDQQNVKGCSQLIDELLGTGYSETLSIDYNFNTGVCRYMGTHGSSISYQTTSGRVIFVTESH
ncbi:hypothetical protein [Shewanella youngdeokensis]|uniref:Uncharacterized protein n=1 Tax=Shewanella youngdeokensis TaxID=2999068 RepID=A0ABZ0JYG6_9GAMM|nr:hypothetical protein RGE70_15985 [Shewanella sp. DAU334]